MAASSQDDLVYLLIIEEHLFFIHENTTAPGVLCFLSKIFICTKSISTDIPRTARIYPFCATMYLDYPWPITFSAIFVCNNFSLNIALTFAPFTK